MADYALASGGPKINPPPKAKSIKELAQRYNSESCAQCHEKIYDQWENSLHARSILGTPRTAPTILTAIDKGLKRFPFSGVKTDDDITVEKLMFCAKCHLPQLDEVAREIVATIREWQRANKLGNDDLANKLEEKIESLNIGCMVCHNKKALIHKWADGYPQPDTVYGSQDGVHDHPIIKKDIHFSFPFFFHFSSKCFKEFLLNYKKA